jgi:hypothetical protein
MSQNENDRDSSGDDNTRDSSHNENSGKAEVAHDTSVESHNAPAAAAIPHDSDADGKAFRLYLAALGRTPDSSGLATWMNAINGGSDLEHVASGFTHSNEFQSKYGDLNNSDYIHQLYANVLHREPDAAGLANWMGALNSGETREHVLIGFSESAENHAHAAEMVHGVDYQTWVG